MAVFSKMRIEATVEILNRSANMRTKPTRTSLAIGRKPLQCENGQDPKIFLMVCTAANRAGTKFKIQANMRRIFDKFVNEGKCTISLMEPPKDFLISKSDPLKLKAFLNVISRVLKAQSDEQLDQIPLTAAALQPVSLAQVTKPKEKMVVENKKDYPITKNFPSTLTCLTINGINLKRFDSRILKLNKLTVLNLNDNSLATIPESFTSLPALSELHLANNCISRLPIGFFLCPGLKKSLGYLNLKNNKVAMIPHQISNLLNLYSIDLSANALKRLPNTLHLLPRLKRIELLDNPDLKMLPGGAFLTLKFEHFSIGSQALTHDAAALCLKDSSNQVPHLQDLCMIYFSKKGLKGHVETCIPPVNRDYWNRIQKCYCGKYCPVSANVISVVKTNPKKITLNFVSDQINGGSFVRCETIFCSRSCFESFQNQSF